jgi:hypothetical protein
MFVFQYLVHRCLCLKTLRSSKIALYSNYVGQVFLFCVVATIGIVLYAYYRDCDPYLGPTLIHFLCVAKNKLEHFFLALARCYKTFYVSNYECCNKLDCLSLPSLSGLVLYL